MKQTIWITRDSASGLISRGLGQVFVWFHEPCLNIEIANDDPFSNENHLQDNLRHQLEGVLFGPNCRYNFLYRDNKIIRNDGQSIETELSDELIELYKHRKLTFRHEVFGSGQKVSYRPNSVGNLFGYDCELSQHIWELIRKDFNENVGKTTTIQEFYDWDKIEEDRPWFKFCKQIEIDITLSK